MRLRNILLFVVILCSGCTPGLKSVVFNNTSHLVVVEVCSKTYEIAVGASAEIQNILCEEASTIQIGDNLFHYKVKFINYPIEEKFNDYVEKNVGNRVIKYQINENGTILIVPVKIGFPYVENIKQPPGFPLKPKNS